MTNTQEDSTHAATDDTAAKFRRLRRLNSELRLQCNKHDRAITMIGACLIEEFDTRARIVGVLDKIGLNRQHVAIILNEGTGPDPNAMGGWSMPRAGILRTRTDRSLASNSLIPRLSRAEACAARSGRRAFRTTGKLAWEKDHKGPGQST